MHSRLEVMMRKQENGRKETFIDYSDPRNQVCEEDTD